LRRDGLGLPALIVSIATAAAPMTARDIRRWLSLMLVDDMSSTLTTAACTLATSATRDKHAISR